MNISIRGLVLLLLTLALGAKVVRLYHPYTFTHADAGWQIISVISLAEDGDLDMRNQLGGEVQAAGDQVALGRHGQWYDVHEYLLPLLALPFYLLFGINGTLIFNFLASILLLVLVYEICRKNSSELAALGAAVAAFIVLEDVSTVYYFSTDTLGAVLLAGSIVCVIYRRPALGGLVFGLAFLGRFSNIAALPGMLFFAAAFGGKHAAYRFTCAFVPGLLGFALGNHLMFGSPFTCSYFRQAYAVDGVLQVVSQERFFSFEHVGRNLWNMFINRSTGFAVSAPLMLFGFLFGLPALWRNARPTVLAIVVISAGQLLFFAFYENALANGGGPRHVLGMLMLWAAPLAACFDQALMPGQNR